MYEHITKAKSNEYKKTFIFIDEVQEIESWEKAINSLLAEKHYDIYISGSNARLLSSELSTLLAGRYVELKMYTLLYSEFKELLHTRKQSAGISDFNLFLKYGGFPGIHQLELDDTVVRQYLHSVYNTVLLRDIVVRNNIRDAAMLDSITKYLIDNCGNITSAKGISQYMKSQQRRISVDTVLNYIHYSCNAMVFEQLKRYDINGKRHLETHEKYFLSDIGFRYATIGYSPQAISGQLENIILLELLARGYRVSIGKLGNKEVDFIAEKGAEKTYIQVCTSLSDEKVIQREYSALEEIKDHFPKVVLSLDKGFDTSRKGIQWMNIEDFLLNDTV